MKTSVEVPKVVFALRKTIEQVEEGNDLAPKFDSDGLMVCVTTDHASGEVLMVGYMNEMAMRKTIETGEAHYWSRSRKKLWHKGANSGLTQEIVELRIDDDQDALWLRVKVHSLGASCHVGYRSCFYRRVAIGEELQGQGDLKFMEEQKVFDPLDIYGNVPNPTIL